MNLLSNKTAIITGASRGIGRAIAIEFAKEGANIAFTTIYRDEDVDSLEKELSSIGVKYKFYEGDARDYSRAIEIVNNVEKYFSQIDILVNNAGIGIPNLLMLMKEEQWDAVIETNLKSVFNYTKAVIDKMVLQRSGAIINISSIAGIVGVFGHANYSASKAGIIGFTKSLAKEVGRWNIRINAIAPGYIETNMSEQLSKAQKDTLISYIPMKRAGVPKDVANLAVFLTSDMSNYISGQIIGVDGALTIL